MIWSLATEDELSEVVGIRLLEEQGVSPYQCLRKGGSGYLLKKRDNWKELSKLHPVLLLTDLDQLACPVALKNGWYGTDPLPERLCFRIAVREVEAWLLADQEALKILLGAKVKQLDAPEAHPDPKMHLLQLAKAAPRAIREDLVREEGKALKQGLGYNVRLCHFVRNVWDPERAAQRAPSLASARRRIAQLVAKSRT